MRKRKFRIYDFETQRMIAPYMNISNTEITVSHEMKTGKRVMLMESTGKKDRHRFDIYECDRLKGYVRTEFGSLVEKQGVVRYSIDSAAFMLAVWERDDADVPYQFDYYLNEFEQLEVIGYEIQHKNENEIVGKNV